MIAITADARPALRRRLSGCTITIYLHSLITAIVHGHQTRKKLPLMKDRGQTDRVTILVNCNSNRFNVRAIDRSEQPVAPTSASCKHPITLTLVIDL